MRKIIYVIELLFDHHINFDKMISEALKRYEEVLR